MTQARAPAQATFGRALAGRKGREGEGRRSLGALLSSWRSQFCPPFLALLPRRVKCAAQARSKLVVGCTNGLVVLLEVLKKSLSSFILSM